MATTASVSKVALYPNDGTTAKPVIVTISDKSLSALTRVLSGSSTLSGGGGGMDGGEGGGVGESETRSNWRGMLKNLAGIGLLVGIMKKMLANSQVLNAYQSAMGKIFGAAMDMLLMPFLPLLNLIIVVMNKLLIWLVSSGVLEKIQKVVEKMVKYLEAIWKWFSAFFKAIIHGEWGEAVRLLVVAFKAIGSEIVQAIKDAFHGDWTKAAGLAGTTALISGIIGKIMGVGFFRGAIWPFAQAGKLLGRGGMAGISGLGRLLGIGGSAAGGTAVAEGGVALAESAIAVETGGAALAESAAAMTASAAAVETGGVALAEGAAIAGGEAAVGGAAAGGTAAISAVAWPIAAAIAAAVALALATYFGGKLVEKTVDKWEAKHGVSRKSMIARQFGKEMQWAVTKPWRNWKGFMLGGPQWPVTVAAQMAYRSYKEGSKNWKEYQADQQAGAGLSGYDPSVVNSNNTINLGVVVDGKDSGVAVNEAINAAQRSSGYQFNGGTGSFSGNPMPINTKSSSWGGKAKTGFSKYLDFMLG